MEEDESEEKVIVARPWAWHSEESENEVLVYAKKQLEDETITRAEYDHIVSMEEQRQEVEQAEAEKIKEIEEKIYQEEEQRMWLENDYTMLIEDYFTQEYLRQQGKLPPPEYLNDEVSKFARRREQLVEFYQEHNPAKIMEVDKILANYKFKDTMESLLSTYGTVPYGWDLQLAVDDLQPEKRKEEFPAYKSKSRAFQQQHLENGIIAWKRKNPDGTYEQWLKDEMSGNIKFDDQGNVVWIDPRAGNLKFAFKKMRSFDPLHNLGDAPMPDESLEPEPEKNHAEIEDLFAR